MTYQARPANVPASQAKGLIYAQEADRPITPVRKGTKGPAGAAQAAAPFAVADVPGDIYPTDFHLVDKRKQEVSGKAGADGFDSSVYLANRHDNARNMAESKTRNYAGGGTPYAMHEVDQAAIYSRGVSFHLQDNSKQLPEKIGATTTFDPEVYRQSILEHQMQQQTSKQRNCGGSNTSTGGGGCPFAVSDSEEFRQQWYRADYHAKAAGKKFAEKVGAEKTFDAGVYSKALAANREHQAESMQRNFVGGGDILAFTPNSS